MSITWIGLDKVIAKLKSLQAPELTNEMRKTQEKVNAYVFSQVPDYPAKRPGQTYVRRMSGGIGGSITTKVEGMGSDIVGKIGSSIEYAPWVISDEAAGGAGPQAWMHKGRWWTLQGVVKKAQAEINRFFEDMIARLVNK